MVDQGSRPVEERTVGELNLAWPSPRYWFQIAAGVIGIVVSVLLFLKLQGVFLVVIASFVLALGLQPAVDWLMERGLVRWQAMGVVLVAGALGAAAVLLALIPVLLSQLDEIIAAVPAFLDDIRAGGGPLATLVDRFDWEMIIDDGGAGILPAVSGMAGALFNAVTVLILTPYFAYAFPSIKRFLLRLLRREDRPEFLRMVNESVDKISGYIAGNLTVSVIATAISFAAFWLMELPFPLALALWVGITDLIPVVGAFLGAAPAVALAAGESTGLVVAVVIFIVVYQQVENYVIAPRVMKRAVDLSPPTVILALMIGGSLAGALGALLALPIAALVKIVVTDYVIVKRVEDVRTAALNGDRSTPRRRPSEVRPLP